MTQHTHTHLRTHLQNIATAAVACMLFGFATTANADLVETHWTNPAGGEFHNSANWSNGVPDSDACAIFDLPGFFPVTFEEFATSDRLVLRQGTVNLELGTATYELLNPMPQTSSLTIGEVDGDIAALLQTSGALMTKFTAIGLNEGASGSVDLFGPNTEFAADFQLTVGDRGSGILDINAGATLNAFSLTLGLEGSGIGEVTVFGSETSLDANLFRIGMQGTASLLIAGGATVNSNDGSIAQQEFALGSVLVDGTDSIWNVDGLLDVGERDFGELVVTNGGVVTVSASATAGTWTNFDGVFPGDTWGTGTISVYGPKSQLLVNDALLIGFHGSGELTIADGAFVHSGSGEVAGYPVDDPKALIDGMNSEWFVDDLMYVDWHATLDVRNGGHVDALLVQSRGKITGNGMITGDLIAEENGTVEPGVPFDWIDYDDMDLVLGELTIQGNYTQASESTLAIGLRGGHYDSQKGEVVPHEVSRLNISGDASLSGTLEVDLGEFSFDEGDSFDILIADSIDGVFSQVTGEQPPFGHVWAIQYLPDRVRLVILDDNPYDLNGDAFVGAADLLLLLQNWGECDVPCPPTCIGDGNEDCVVDTQDLLGLLDAWAP